MFDGVVMDVIQMLIKVGFVTDTMLEKTWLPNGFCTVFFTLAETLREKAVLIICHRVE